jgi:hypothetical protein
MSSWANLDADATAAMQQAFGEPVVYQPVINGQANGDPVTITAVRHRRAREEFGATANVEEISINPADLPAPPARGDWVTAWGLTFVVGPLRQPDPYGMVQLSLTVKPQ